MLNPFPIQFLAPLAYVLLRVVLGFLFIKIGSEGLKQSSTGSGSRVIAVTEIVVGILYVLGIMTQLVALVAFGISLLSLVPSLRTRAYTRLAPRTAILIAAISLSLFITGAGPFAFDLPI